MDTFLEMYNHSRLNQKGIEYINILITINELESLIIKKLSTNKSPRPGDFISESYQIFREELTSVLLKLFPKIVEE